MAQPVRLNGQTWYQWARELFEYEYCGECGKGVRGHLSAITPLGTWFAFCKEGRNYDD